MVKQYILIFVSPFLTMVFCGGYNICNESVDSIFFEANHQTLSPL